MKKYDVFISYAVEDKNPIAISVATGLRLHGFEVYFVSDELGSGDSVSQTVYDGLENSSYFVPILSPYYVRRWTTIEWSNILRREKKSGRGLIFPIWHGLAQQDVKQLFPELIDHYAKSTADGMEMVISDLAVELKKRKKQDALRRWMRTSALVLVFGILGVGARAAFSVSGETNNMPSTADAEAIIRAHIDAYQEKINLELFQSESLLDVAPIEIDSVKQIYAHYKKMSESSRNDYYFSTAYESVTGHDNIEERGIVLAESPLSAYGVSASHICYLERRVTDSTSYHHLAFADTAQVNFQIDTMYYDVRTHDVHVYVNYDRCLLCVYYKLNYSTNDEKIRQHVRLEGFKPEEEYIMSNQSGRWELQTVQ